jgi:hypothetical protein
MRDQDDDGGMRINEDSPIKLNLMHTNANTDKSKNMKNNI